MTNKTERQHIPPNIVQEFRASLSSDHNSRLFHKKYPDFCNHTIAYFEKMGHFAASAATREDLDKHIQTVTEVLTRQTGQIKEHERRIGDFDLRLKQAEFLAQSTKVSIDTNTELSRQQLQLSQTISARLDEVAERVSTEQAPTAEHLAKLPPLAWPVLGVVVIAAISAISGQMGAFIAWLGSVSVFGGVQ